MANESGSGSEYESAAEDTQEAIPPKNKEPVKAASSPSAPPRTKAENTPEKSKGDPSPVKRKPLQQQQQQQQQRGKKKDRQNASKKEVGSASTLIQLDNELEAVTAPE
eukprot:Opistho-2@77108